MARGHAPWRQGAGRSIASPWRLGACWRLAVTTALALAAFAGAGDEAHGQSRTPAFLLMEEAVMVLPDDFVLAGLGTGHRGDLLVWAEAPSRVLRLSPTLTLEASWTLPDSLRPLAVSSRASGLEVVGAEPPALHYFDAEGAPRGETALSIDGMLLSAARGTDGWYLLSESSAGVVAVRHRGRAGYAVVPRYGALTPDEDGVWITATTYPFEARLLHDDWSRGVTLRPPAEVLDSMRAAAEQRDLTVWASLPLVVLDRRYVQTIADLEQDRRLIVVYDRAGTVLTSLAVDVPLGILAAAGHRRVYAVRRTDVLEIVGYSYEWGDASRSLPATDGGPWPALMGGRVSDPVSGLRRK